MSKNRWLFLALAACILVSGCGKFKKKAAEEEVVAPTVLTEYKLENDSVKSVPWVLGEDRIHSSEKYLNVELPQESVEGEEAEAATEEETTEESAEESKAEGEEETTEEVPKDPDDDGTKKVVISYEAQETGLDDALAYIHYLEDQEGFTPEWELNEAAPAGYMSFARPSVDEGWMFQVDVDYTPRSYRIILTKWELPVVEETEEGVSDVKVTSMEQAISYIKSYSPKALKISDEETLDGYSVVADPGRRPIGGMDYYVVNVYQNHEDMTKTIAGTYYVGVNTGQVLKYDLDTDSYSEITFDRSALESSSGLNLDIFGTAPTKAEEPSEEAGKEESAEESQEAPSLESEGQSQEETETDSGEESQEEVSQEENVAGEDGDAL